MTYLPRPEDVKPNTIICGDALEVLRGMPSDYFDSCVTDPPYGLGFMGVKWDTFGDGKGRGPSEKHNFDHVGGNHNPENAFDATRTRRAEAVRFEEWCYQWAKEVFRVLKPGAHLLSFGGSRTYHRMACAIEDAGFEIRDQIMWIYGSGFPKSLDISKAIDKAAGAEREVIGQRGYSSPDIRGNSSNGRGISGPENEGRERLNVPITTAATDAARQWSGWGTALKPAHEPIVVARKPFKGTVAENVLRYGTGGINIDGGRVDYENGGSLSSNPLLRNQAGHRHFQGPDNQSSNYSMKKNAGDFVPDAQGRFPANVIHDGSEEVVRLFPEVKAGANVTGEETSKVGTANCYSEYGRVSFNGYADNGSAARFFYCAKASRQERGPGNNHPTVKPIALIQYLVKLVTPPCGIVLDPFMGSGTLGIAAGKLGMKWVGIEKIQHHIEIAERRIEREVGLLLDAEAQS